jgi:putative transposase
MRRSKAEIYLHVVWSTKGRQPRLAPDIERFVYRCLESEAREMGCDVLAIGGTDDHVHVVVKVPTGVAPSALAKQMKGVSSRFIRERIQDHEGFGWQEGYGVFSLSRPDVKRVILYVERQKEHHFAGSLWPQWEETDTAAPTQTPAAQAASPGGRSAEGPSDGYFNARKDDRANLYSLLGDLPAMDRPVSAETVREEEREA